MKKEVKITAESSRLHSSGKYVAFSVSESKMGLAYRWFFFFNCKKRDNKRAGKKLTYERDSSEFFPFPYFMAVLLRYVRRDE